MSHLLRAVDDATWKRGYVTVGTDLRNIDQNTFVAVNGDAGGTWTPAASLTIGGAGVVVAGPWQVAGSQMTIAAPTFAKGTSDDCFGLATTHAGRTQTLVQALLECHADFPEGIVADPGYNSTGLFGLLTQKVGVRFYCPIRVFNGATLETVTLNFSLSQVHVTLPVLYPVMRIIAMDANGVSLPMGAGSLYGTDGFHAITAVTTVAAYNALGATSFVYACSQNNVIDTSKYTYWLEIIDESGGGAIADNVYLSAVSFLDAIALFDGRN